MKLKLLTILLLVCFGMTLSAQENNDTDAELLFWTGLSANYKFNKKWRVELEQQLRFENESDYFEKTFSELAVRYKVDDWLNFKLKYRYSWINDERNQGRISFETNLSWDIKDNPIDVNYRFRIQDAKVSYTGEKRTYFRNKLELDANLTKLVDPQIAYEHFYRIDKKETRVHRFTLSLEWKLRKNSSLKTFYRIDREVNTKNNEMQHIIGAMVSYDLN